MTVTRSLIPRRVFFDNPDRVCVRLSPDGEHIAFIAPHKGVMNIWVAPRNDLDAAKPLTHESKRGLMSFQWAWDSEHLLYSKDTEGDENWHLHALHIQTLEDIDLTPFDNVAVRLTKISQNYPDEVIVSVNERRQDFHDLYCINLKTGDYKVLIENNEFVGFLVDDCFAVRFGMRLLPDGSTQLDKFQDGTVSVFDRIPYEDALGTNPLGFAKDLNHLYFLDSRGRDTTALYLVDCDTKEKKLLGACDKADISNVLINPLTYSLEGWSSTYEKDHWRFVDEVIATEIEGIQKQIKGNSEILSRSQDDQHWIVVCASDVGPAHYYLYERQNQQLSFLFTSQSSLEGLSLLPMEPKIITARDGLDLVCYLTKPEQDAVAQPVPLILMVHGGPQARDHWGYNATTQWLANRGYAVLSVNYRGSTGFGKSFTNAGDGEWSRKMHDDLIDAVEWAIAHGITDREKVCIYGGSYGGYATLVGLTFTPEVFACGVDIVGPSNLKTLIETIPAYWKPVLDMLKKRVGGDLDSEQGLKELADRSPLHKVDQITKPLLMAQGANDPRVKQSESDQFVEALSQKGIPATYVLYPDEGHGFANPQNRMSFFAITELFLQQHLGGQAEPIGKDFDGSRHQFLAHGPEFSSLNVV